MNKRCIFFAAISMFVATSPVFAHDHSGTQQSMEHAAAPDEQSAKESETLLDSCAQKIGRIERRINKLRMEVDPKHTAGSINEELKKLEQKLDEAGDIVRPLQIF